MRSSSLLALEGSFYPTLAQENTPVHLFTFSHRVYPQFPETVQGDEWPDSPRWATLSVTHQEGYHLMLLLALGDAVIYSNFSAQSFMKKENETFVGRLILQLEKVHHVNLKGWN